MAAGAPLLVGVDGGGTHCRVRIDTPGGEVVGEGRGGSANVFTDVAGAFATIEASIEEALKSGGLSRRDFARCHVGLGLAGANIPSVARQAAARDMPFAAYRLVSDAVTGCIGAHGGVDGGLAILGTGSAYVAQKGERFTIFGGWGLAVSDHGSGADLGRAALAAALLAHDAVGPASGLTEALLNRFGHDPAAVSTFAGTARPRDFGAFAPLIFDCAEAGDPVALAVVERAQCLVEASLRRLLTLGVPTIAMLGGVSSRYRPRLPADLAPRIVDPIGTALDGALILARRTLPQ